MENYSPPVTKERQNLLIGMVVAIFSSAFLASFLMNPDARITFAVSFIAFFLSSVCLYFNFKYRREDFIRINIFSILIFCCSLLGLILSITIPSFEFLMFFGIIPVFSNLGLFIMASVLACRGIPIQKNKF